MHAAADHIENLEKALVDLRGVIVECAKALQGFGDETKALELCRKALPEGTFPDGSGQDDEEDHGSA